MKRICVIWSVIALCLCSCVKNKDNSSAEAESVVVASETTVPAVPEKKVQPGIVVKKDDEPEVKRFGDEVTVKRFEVSLRELEKAIDLTDVHKIVFEQCTFSDGDKTVLSSADAVTVIIMKNCTLKTLDFLSAFPSLEAVYAPHVVLMFPDEYEVDLSDCKNLVFIDMFEMNFHITFSRIKALPPSLEVFAMYDARFDWTNLPELQEKNPRLKFSLPIDEAEWKAKGVCFTTFEDMQAAEKKYHLGLK